MDNFNTSNSGHILVASGDVKDYDLLRRHFESSGFVIEHCDSLRDVYMTDLSDYCLILLDLSDQIEEGIHAIQTIKQGGGSIVPVLVYSTTRRSDVLVNALNAGADDYVIKPFSLRELSARVRAVLRSTRRG